MNLAPVILLISLVWLVSEVVLTRVKRSERLGATDQDKSSLRFIWMTIAICVSTGVFLGLARIGLLSAKSYFISLSGLVLIVLGLAIRWTAILTLRRYFTVDVAIVSDHRIIKKGIYKAIRHPAYTGSLLSFLGLGLSFSNWLSTLVIFVPMLAAFLYRIKVEEKALIESFGDEYLNYCKVTKRLIPLVY